LTDGEKERERERERDVELCTSADDDMSACQGMKVVYASVCMYAVYERKREEEK
jgi:hypothetical protein